MEEKLTFEVTENGKTIKYEELYTFKNEETGKEYMAYTDNSKDEDDKIRVFVAIYDANNKKLIPIEDDEEWAFVEETIDLLQEDE